MSEIILYSVVFVGAYLGVRYFRLWSLRKKLLDIPNERSSHTTPTPRGGGLIIVLASLVGFVGYSLATGRNFSGVYVLGALAIAIVSWFDDLVTISFVWRFLIHSAAAILVISTLGYFGQIYLPFAGSFNFGIWGSIFTFVWIVWLTNAFNFMDGIDGLAGIQAVIAGIGWMFWGEMSGSDETYLLAGVLCFSSLGFLIQNWQPAKIFMGDVGSAFLGFSFAVLPLIAKNGQAADDSISPVLPLFAVALIWLFLFDTVLTFLKRAFKGEKVWRAHRWHIYQKLVILGQTHRFVSILYGAISAVPIFFLIFAPRQKQILTSGLVCIMILQSFGVSGVLYFTKKMSGQNK